MKVKYIKGSDGWYVEANDGELNIGPFRTRAIARKAYEAFKQFCSVVNVLSEE